MDAQNVRHNGHPVVTPQAFLEFVGDHLPQEASLDRPLLTREELHEAAMRKKSTAGELDGWLGLERDQGTLSIFVCGTCLSSAPNAAGQGPQGLLDAHMAMIPKAEGVYRILSSLRLALIQDWFYSWVPDSVFTAGKGCPQLMRGTPPPLTLLFWLHKFLKFYLKLQKGTAAKKEAEEGSTTQKEEDGKASPTKEREKAAPHQRKIGTLQEAPPIKAEEDSTTREGGSTEKKERSDRMQHPP